MWKRSLRGHLTVTLTVISFKGDPTEPQGGSWCWLPAQKDFSEWLVCAPDPNILWSLSRAFLGGRSSWLSPWVLNEKWIWTKHTWLRKKLVVSGFTLLFTWLAWVVQLTHLGRRNLDWRIIVIGWARGHVCEAFSYLLSDVGEPSTMWVVLPLVLGCIRN